MSPAVLDRTRKTKRQAQESMGQTERHEQEKEGKKPDPEMTVGAPPNLPRLQQFFQSQSALAEALGVHRDTLRKWERGEAEMLRKHSIQRVAVMCALAEQVARYMPKDEFVGS